MDKYKHAFHIVFSIGERLIEQKARGGYYTLGDEYGLTYILIKFQFTTKIMEMIITKKPRASFFIDSWLFILLFTFLAVTSNQV